MSAIFPVVWLLILARWAATASASWKVWVTKTCNFPSWASRASSRRASLRILVPGSAPGAPPRTLIPAARLRLTATMVAIRAWSATSASENVDRLIGADQVQRGVDPAGRGGADPLSQAVARRHEHGAELAEKAVLCRAGRGHQRGPASGRELDRHDADTASGAMNQDRVPSSTPVAVRACQAVTSVSISPAVCAKSSAGGLGTRA